MPWAPVLSALGNGLRLELRASSPNTEPNDGIANDRGLVCILGLRDPVGGPDLGERLLFLLGHRGGSGARKDGVG